MIPRAILKNLSRLRRRERLLAFVWGAALWLTVVLSALAVACLVDWLIDRERDTPAQVRRLLLAVQVIAAAAAGYFFLFRPQWRRLHNDTLALWVEERQPALAHRLITAVQLDRPGARSEGMSLELIAVVTREAQLQSERLDFASIADHRRLHRAALTLLPVVAVILLLVALDPRLARVLVVRQFQADVDIPHSVVLESLKLDDVRPAGERVVLKFRVRAEQIDPNWQGVVYVTPDGQARDHYPLEFAASDGDGAIFQAVLAPTATSMTYTARLNDGRMRRPGRVAMVPRPIVQEQLAWVQLPAFCGVKPDGSRYEQAQGRGDIVGIPGSAARIQIKTQKPVRRAFLQLLGEQPAGSDAKGQSVVPEPTREVVQREIALTLSSDGMIGEGTFDLQAGESAYRAVVVDEYDFENVPAPRRGLRLVAEEPPQVALLKEQMPPHGPVAPGTWEDFAVDGLPVVPGKKIRVAYIAQGPFGLGQARFLYRVIRKTESGDDEVKEQPWRVLPLQEIKASDKSGAFDPKRGAFEHSSLEESVWFHPVPSPAPDLQLGRTLGGGRFDFDTTGIPDGRGGSVPLRVGDQFEFCIEVFADKDGSPTRPSARSEVRVRPIISQEELVRWLVDAQNEQNRLRDLDKKQRGVFELR